MRSNKRIHEYFDFTTFNETVPFLILKEDQHKHVKHCGTHGCMAGELPGIWKSWYFDEEGKLCFIKARLTIRQAIAIWFNLSRNEVFILFYPNTVGLVKGQLPIRATLREVTKNLENFIRSKSSPNKFKSGKKKGKVEKFPCAGCEIPSECVDLEYCPKEALDKYVVFK
jgi:hypothetical protein